jgi:hypothetical protein
MVARLEIWPFGNYKERRGIATIKIANLGTAHDGLTEYAVVLQDDDHERWAYCYHWREDGAVTLLAVAMDALEFDV